MSGASALFPSTSPRDDCFDADFDLPDGDILRSPAVLGDKDDEDEDWDMEMDLGKTSGAKAVALPVVGGITALAPKAMVTIHPPTPAASRTTPQDTNDMDDEGVSTIKVSALPHIPKKSAVRLTQADDDFEGDFALPPNLDQLSLKPLSLHHRSSKSSLEWGDRDHTSSSTSSSEAYSSLGFGVSASPSTNSTSASLPGTDDDGEDDEEDALDGLVLPGGLFESDQGRKHLKSLLDMKKKLPKVDEQVKVLPPDPEDDFEIGLIIDDSVDLSQRKLKTLQVQTKRVDTLNNRSKSMPSRPATSIAPRPPSRLRSERTRTDPHLELPNSQRLGPSNRPHNLQSLSSAPPGSTFLVPKGGSLRGQKSHSTLNTSPPSSNRKLTRKASLSSLVETSSDRGSALSPVPGPSQGYSAATVASRARIHPNSTTRLHAFEYALPPSRPSTPSAHPAALRLTLPTLSSRSKIRPPVSSVFQAWTPQPTPQRVENSQTPTSLSQASIGPPVARILRRTKRRNFGDGTELDGIADLPADKDKEAKYRVQPKPTQNRVPGGSFSKTDRDLRGTIRRRADLTTDKPDLLHRPSFLSENKQQLKNSLPTHSKWDAFNKKKRNNTPNNPQTRRKPTLIRNLGGAGAPKVVGDMRWNPQTLRWEGNEQVLKDFDMAVGTSTRPALITQLTGSSMGSPVGTFASAARVVGNMVFDPERMCWLSTLAPEEDEPDVFADLADDEEDVDSWESKGGTIRANQARPGNPQSETSVTSLNSNSNRVHPPSPARSRAMSESGSDRGSRASLVCEVDDKFYGICRDAEARHLVEMTAWATLDDSDRSYLFDIRAVATRQY